MNKTLIAAALAVGLMFGYSGRAWTQSDPKLPMPGYAVAKDIPGALCAKKTCFSEKLPAALA